MLTIYYLCWGVIINQHFSPGTARAPRWRCCCWVWPRPAWPSLGSGCSKPGRCFQWFRLKNLYIYMHAVHFNIYTIAYIYNIYIYIKYIYIHHIYIYVCVLHATRNWRLPHNVFTSQVKGAAGQNCDSTCASRSGCSEEAWPKSEEEFQVRRAGRELWPIFSDGKWVINGLSQSIVIDSG
jgi:hypothetical protein